MNQRAWLVAMIRPSEVVAATPAQFVGVPLVASVGIFSEPSPTYYNKGVTAVIYETPTCETYEEAHADVMRYVKLCHPWLEPLIVKRGL